MSRRFFAVCLVLLAAPAPWIFAQPDEQKPTDTSNAAQHAAAGVNGWRLAAVGTAAASTLGVTYLYLEDTWWKDGNTRFKFDDGGDIRYAHNLDKLAHFYGGAIAADMFSGGLRWAGVDRSSAAWYGLGLSVFVQMVIEIKDGYSPRWGYSVLDVASGSAGALFTTGKQLLPALDVLDVKFSYLQRSDKYFTRIKSDGTGTWNDDYINQTYWLSLKVNSVLPETAERWWPDWLAVAVGLGVDDALQGYEKGKSLDTGNLEVYLALDCDVTRILPSENEFWETVKRYLNYVKFPAPAVRLTPSVVWFGLYF